MPLCKCRCSAKKQKTKIPAHLQSHILVVIYICVYIYLKLLPKHHTLEWVCQVTSSAGRTYRWEYLKIGFLCYLWLFSANWSKSGNQPLGGETWPVPCARTCVRPWGADILAFLLAAPHFRFPELHSCFMIHRFLCVLKPCFMPWQLLIFNLCECYDFMKNIVDFPNLLVTHIASGFWMFWIRLYLP